MKKLLLFLCVSACFSSFAQNGYQYTVDLTASKDDKLEVTLVTPKINKPAIKFKFPKIIPGTYRNADYGQFVSNLKALDKNGKVLPVKQTDINTWTVSNATQLAKVTYTIEDTWDSEKGKTLYTMAGTNIEEGKNFVVNTPGFFGYFDGFRNTAFTIEFKKPENFYASTSMKPIASNSGMDRFQVKSLDELYDNPIMFCLPDTTTLEVGGATILVSVYSPKRKMSAAIVAQGLAQNLRASAKYLGGALPVSHYAFIFYFNGEQNPSIAQGALEHNYSSFYTMQEAGPQQIMGYVLDVTAHEFFHVLTPLNFSSKEIKEFNFDKPVFSKHLWLYEGSTEYASDHMQVKYGLNSVDEFLGKLTEKIRLSRKLNDTLPFTRMSKEVATTYKDQYLNVYEKGALISACLDLELLRLSNGAYNLQQLKHDLSIRYGKDKYFDDDELFDVITKMTYPEIRMFFAKYVEGNLPIPYADYFALAGVSIVPEKKNEEISLGGFAPTLSADGKIIITDLSHMNDFGKKMGYKLNDQVLSIQGIKVTSQNFWQVIGQVKSRLKAGDSLSIMALRDGGAEPIQLSSVVVPLVTIKKNVLELMPNAGEMQAKIRNAWLSTPDRPIAGLANPDDVKDINAVITALYQSISGPAGPRNWERFRTLFYPGAQMAASHNLPNGQQAFMSMTFEEYIQMNAPFMANNSFYEKEIGRRLDQYGGIAVAKSAYQFGFTENGKIEQRGINNISLVRDKGRWYISNITWQDESPNNPIPDEISK